MLITYFCDECCLTLKLLGPTDTEKTNLLPQTYDQGELLKEWQNEKPGEIPVVLELSSATPRQYLCPWQRTASAAIATAAPPGPACVQGDCHFASS